MMNVVIVDWEVVRKGIKSLLETDGRFQITGETDDGLEAVGIVEKLKPDILILELVINNINGIEVLRQASRLSPKTKVIVHTFSENRSYVFDAIRSGAKAYILKTYGTEELKTAINETISGRHFLSAPLSELAIEALMAQGNTHSDDPYESLTKREREIMQLAAAGYSNPEIAARLFISRRTVEAHRSNIIHKLGLHVSQGQLVQYAWSHGIMLPSQSSKCQSEGNTVSAALNSY